MSRRAVLVLAAMFAGVIGLGVWMVGFGTTVRTPYSTCLRCGVAQSRLFREVPFFGTSLRLPIGTAVSGAGAQTAECPHELRYHEGRPRY
jgi:hypothetical protein